MRQTIIFYYYYFANRINHCYEISVSIWYHCHANIFYSSLRNVHLNRTVLHFWFHDDFDRQLVHVNCARVLRALISRINSCIVRSHCIESSKWINWISWNNFNSAFICAINTTVPVVCFVSLSIFPAEYQWNYFYNKDILTFLGHWEAFATYLVAAQKSTFLFHSCQQRLLTRVLC